MAMLYRGRSISEIKNHLGHENANSTMAYLHMEMTQMRTVQNRLIEYMQANLADDKQIDELIDWENRKEILEWLDSL
jgi:integrase